MHHCKHRSCGRKIKVSFPPSRETKLSSSRFAPKTAIPINPALSSSLLTLIKHCKAVGQNSNHFLTVCSKDCKRSCAYSTHPTGHEDLNESTPGPISPKQAEEEIQNFILCLSHTSIPGKGWFRFKSWFSFLFDSLNNSLLSLLLVLLCSNGEGRDASASPLLEDRPDDKEHLILSHTSH